MLNPYTITLLNVAPSVAELFRTDREAAELIDPAVYIDVDGATPVIRIIERSLLIEAMTNAESIDARRFLDESPTDLPIAVLVINKSGATLFRVPDPRLHPELSPWRGCHRATT